MPCDELNGLTLMRDRADGRIMPCRRHGPVKGVFWHMKVMADPAHNTR